MNLGEAKAVACATGWLAAQDPAFQTVLCASAVLRSYKTNTPIYHQEDGATEIYCLVSGIVVMSVSHPIMGEIIAHVMHPGDWFGEPAALGRRPRFASAEARLPVQVLVFNVAAIGDLVKENPRYAHCFFNLLSNNAESYMLHGVDLLIAEARARLCSRLLTFAGRRLDRTPLGPVTIPVSHEELALASSLSRASVQSILRDFVKAGICELGYRAIVIPDTSKLVRMLDGRHP